MKKIKQRYKWDTDSNKHLWILRSDGRVLLYMVTDLINYVMFPYHEDVWVTQMTSLDTIIGTEITRKEAFASVKAGKLVLITTKL